MRRLLIAITIGVVGLFAAMTMLRATRSYPEIPVSRLSKDSQSYLCVRGVVDSEAPQQDGSWSYTLVDVETGDRVTAYENGPRSGLRRPEIHFVSSACGPVQNFPVMPGITGVHLVGPVEYWRGPQSFHPIDWLRTRVDAKR